jgi:8-oxo-dGTP diphosphatase
MIVAAGVLIEHGRVLIAKRKPDAHLAGAWEMPGGKVEEGEDPREALRRELAEELGIDVCVGEIVDVTFHRYEQADKTILLLFFEATRIPGSAEPRALDVAAFEWSDAGGLDPARFPAGDLAVVRKIRGRLEQLR